MALSTAESPPRLTSLSHGGGCGCKIAPGILEELLRGTAPIAPVADLLVGRETGDDAAVYRISGEEAIVATTDFFMPIVDDPFDFGRIAATNALSDVYAMGGTPLLALAIVGMPLKLIPLATIREILRGGEAACAAAGIPIAGGHSIDSAEPIYGLAAIGRVAPKYVKRNRDAAVGDAIVLGKPLGVGVLAAALKKGVLSSSAYRTLIDTTTCLNRAGAVLARIDGVHAMTDVTGFGLIGHLVGMCRGSGVGASIEFASVPMLPDARRYAEEGIVTGASARNWSAYSASVDLPKTLPASARALLTDPQTSGGLLVSCAPSAVSSVLGAFREHGCEDAAVVGQVLAGPSRIVVC